jgi:serine/threonine protein kinase
VAIKRMEKKKLIQKKQISSAYVEKQLMIKNLDSKFLVKLHSTFQDKNYLYIVMNYVPGGDLLHLLIEKDIFTE